MRFSSEPTREMVFCTTAKSERQLQKRLKALSGREGEAAAMAVAQPNRRYEHNGGVMRFWNWDADDDPEHPIVGILLELARTLPEKQFRLLRITCDDNELETAGNTQLFGYMGIRTILAPRIVF